MSEDVEAAGDLATGAVIARAVEPAHGEGDEGHQQGACLNCGTALVGAYCHACGQSAHLHRSLAGFGHDLLHGVFHFEGKFWRTLPMLLWHPGQLTRRYVHGERARFVSPLALFLFSAFLLYAIAGSIAGDMRVPELSEADKGRTIGEVNATLAKNESQIRALRAQIATRQAAGQETSALRTRLESVEAEDRATRLVQGYLTNGRQGGGLSGLDIHTGWAALDHGMENARRNPDLFLYRLQTSAYKYSWALIPISTPLVWLLFFWKKEYKLYDHLVFVTYSLSFMSLLVVTLTVLAALRMPDSLLSLAGMIVPPVHSYRQLRGAYLCTRVGALVRTALLMLFGLVGLTLFVMLLLAMGLMH